MDFFTIVLTLLFTVTFINGLHLLKNRGNKLPPGPARLPIIGNLHLLGDQPHKSLARLAKTYGPIMCLRLGQINTVVISSSAVAKQVLQKQDLAFSSRTIQDVTRAYDHFQHSIVLLPVASKWRSARRILNTNIFSGSSLDSNKNIRFEKVQELITYCRQNGETGEAVDVGRAAFTTSLNLLSNTIFSRDLTDPFSDSGKEFKTLVTAFTTEAGKPNLADFFPFLSKIDPQGNRRRMATYFREALELFKRLIDERTLEKQNPNDEPKNDVIEVLLRTIQESPEEIDRTFVEHLFLDLFVAGTDTTSSTVEWAMAEALKNPETMKRAKAELEEVIGKGKVLNEADISRLPYLGCVVKETMRLHPPVPFLIPRRVEQDVGICGYIVPKNSQVFVNAWAIGRDAETWDDPLEFKPERFLDSEVDLRGRDFELIPFGAGRRICPGIPLAMRMVPVMVGSLLNCFDWRIESGILPKDLDMEEKFGLTLQKAHSLRAVPIPL